MIKCGCGIIFNLSYKNKHLMSRQHNKIKFLNMIFKECSKCKKTKETNNFNKNNNICKLCLLNNHA